MLWQEYYLFSVERVCYWKDIWSETIVWKEITVGVKQQINVTHKHMVSYIVTSIVITLKPK